MADAHWNAMHLFAGIGGMGLLLPATTVAYVEWDPFCQRVLHAHMGDKTLPWAPVLGNVCSVHLRK